MPIHKTTPEDIIKKSIKVFRQNGYYRTTMNDLAKEIGLTKGVFYHHFSSKEELMIKSLQLTSKWFSKHIFSIAYQTDLSPKERLIQMAQALFQSFTTFKGGCFFANTILETAHVEDTFLEEINLFFKNFEEALIIIYKEKYTEKYLNNIVQETIADIEGSILLMQLKKDTQLLQNALDRAIKRL